MLLISFSNVNSYLDSIFYVSKTFVNSAEEEMFQAPA